MTVPPETSASAAAVTFAAVSPVSGVSSLRWPPHGCCALGADGVVVVVVVEPDPLPAMPYALVAPDGRLFAGLADGQLWESGDRGDTWRACTLRGDALPAVNALAAIS